MSSPSSSRFAKSISEPIVISWLFRRKKFAPVESSLNAIVASPAETLDFVKIGLIVISVRLSKISVGSKL